MKIDSIEVHHIAIPLREPMRTPLGPRDQLETVLVAMHSGSAVGWAEASPGTAPCSGHEWAAGAFALLRGWLAPRVVGQSVSAGEDLTKRLDVFRGNQFAKASLDMAWWDLHARLQNRPLHEVLASVSTPPRQSTAGQPVGRRALELGATFDQMDSIDALLAAIARAAEEGFHRIKLKFRPGWDVRMVDLVRKEFPLLTVQIDCEAGLTLSHTDMLYRLEDFSLALIEQPLPADDLVGHAMVQQSLRTPLCLDESVTTVAQAEMAIELQSCKRVNLKPSRVGGLTAAIAIHDLCQDAGIPCYVGAMPQTAIGARHGLALASMQNCTDPADWFPGDRVLAEDVADPLLPTKSQDGSIRAALWSTPGIGVEPNGESLQRLSVARETISL
ncbi:MAG: o-succinylbenzoate synthase [Planctomycetaceae bacterium]|nr:o-succinylbenzoate synthase [Planctomycetaceae bacterium]